MTLPSPDRDVKDDVIEKMLDAYSAEATKGTTIYRDCMCAAVRALADYYEARAKRTSIALITIDDLRAIAGPET